MALDLEAALAAGPLICDGAMGTMLMASGVESRCPEELNLISPDVVRRIHVAYIEAGANVIEANSFGANRFKLAKVGMEESVVDINRMAATIAREAAGPGVLVAGDVGPLGELLEPLGTVSEADARAAFKEQTEALAAGGADLFIVETMFDLSEATIAVEAAASTGLPVVATMTFDAGGRTMMGVKPVVAARALRAAGATIVGANCGVGPGETLKAIEEMRGAVPEVWLAAQPNAGVPEVVAGKTAYSVSAQEMAEWAPRFVEAGVRLLGSCCGSSPEYTRAISKALGRAL